MNLVFSCCSPATGVAMGNAIEEVKAAAGFVTDTNDNDGVAKFIGKIQG